MDQKHSKDWRELCKAAANEHDPAKLMDLIAELTKALDERDKRLREITWENPDGQNGRSRVFRSQASSAR